MQNSPDTIDVSGHKIGVLIILGHHFGRSKKAPQKVVGGFSQSRDRLGVQASTRQQFVGDVIDDKLEKGILITLQLFLANLELRLGGNQIHAGLLTPHGLGSANGDFGSTFNSLAISHESRHFC